MICKVCVGNGNSFEWYTKQQSESLLPVVSINYPVTTNNKDAPTNIYEAICRR